MVGEEVPAQETLASEKWKQSCVPIGLLGHDSRDVSDPVQATSSK